MIDKKIFEKFNLLPFSPSRLNTYRDFPCGFVMRYIYGYDFPAELLMKNTTMASNIYKSAHENGVEEQTVLVEFESLENAKAFYYGENYQSALKALDGGADRDIRIFEGK